MKSARRIAAGILCAVVACSFSSCKDTTWSYKIEGTTITSGMYIAYQINAYMEAAQEVPDTSADPLTQKIEDKDASVWINEKVDEACKAYVAVEKKFDELGLALNESDETKIENQIENMWMYYGGIYESNGAGKKSVAKIIENNYKSNLIFKKYYDTDGLEAVPEADLKKEFGDNYALVKYVQMPKKDAEGNKLKSDSEALKELKKTAESYVARLNKKENIDDLIKEYEDLLEKQQEENESTSSGTTSNTSSGGASSVGNTSSSGNTSSNSNTSSSGSASSGSTSSGTKEEEETDPNEVVIYKENETLTKKFIDGIFGAKIGVPTIVEDDENYYVTIRYDITADEKKAEDYHDTVLANLKGDEYEARIKEWSKEYQVETNEDSKKRYTLNKIKFS